MAVEARPDHMVGGRYRLTSEIGSGGFGRVWKAHDETLDIAVAVKELRLPPGTSAAERHDLLARATREARNAARLRDHPNIVGVPDVVVEDGVPWIVMQLVEGRSLEQHIALHGPLSEYQAALVATALLKALGAAEAAGITHRDVKPANVLLSDTADILLADFGIAVHRTDTALTATGSLIGSVEYLAPERIRGHHATATSDLFSVGVTLYQALEGFSPFRRDSLVSSLNAVQSEYPPPPANAGRLTPLLSRLLDKDPARRPTIAEALTMLAAPTDTPRFTVPSGPPATAHIQGAPGIPGDGRPVGPTPRWLHDAALTLTGVLIVLIVVGIADGFAAMGEVANMRDVELVLDVEDVADGVYLFLLIALGAYVLTAITFMAAYAARLVGALLDPEAGSGADSVRIPLQAFAVLLGCAVPPLAFGGAAALLYPAVLQDLPAFWASAFGVLLIVTAVFGFDRSARARR